MRKQKYSDGDYKVRRDAKKFKVEFYYINFIDKVGKFDSEYSEQIDDKHFAFNRARWLAKNSWSLSHISYKVVKIGLYSSLNGHIKSYNVE